MTRGKVRLLAAATALALLTAAVPAAAVEFTTAAAYRAGEGPYQGLPLRILFRKLAASDAAARRAIREAILLRYAFDPAWNADRIAVRLPYERVFGVVEEIGNDTLTLRDPSGGGVRTFHLGIDRIPVTGRIDAPPDLALIRRSAVAVFALDERLYRIERLFPIDPPTGLAVAAEGDRNRLTWSPPDQTPAPAGYRVLINGRPGPEVAAPAADVPRTPGRVDTYRVVAIYAQGDRRVPSPPGPAVEDAATARRLAARARAAAVWADILGDLTPAGWTRARERLAAESELLTAHLDPSDRARATTLADLLNRIHEGDRTAGTAPSDPEALAAAMDRYRRAAELAERLAPAVDARFLPQMKIEAAADETRRLENARRVEAARRTWRDIRARFAPGRWEEAREDLDRHRARLAADLPPALARQVEGAAALFHEVDTGRRMAAGASGKADLDLARRFFERADAKAAALRPDLDLGFVVDLARQSANRREAELRQAEAATVVRSRWRRITAMLTPDRWAEARQELYARREELQRHLAEPDRTDAATLEAFFRDIDAGDRQAVVAGEDPQALEAARGRYAAADATAGRLAPRHDVGFVVELRRQALRRRAETRKEKAAAEREAAERAAAEKAAAERAAVERAAERAAAEKAAVEREAAERAAAEKAASEKAAAERAATERAAAEKAAVEREAAERAAAEKAAAEKAAAERAAAERAAAEKAAVEREAAERAAAERAAAEKAAAERATAERAAAERRWAEIRAGFTPEGWPEARAALDAEAGTLMTHLPEGRRGEVEAAVGDLKRFFEQIDKGDQLARRTPETPATLKAAEDFYRRARQQAEALGGRLDVAFIARLRQEAVQRRQEALAAAAARTAAERRWGEIRAGFTPEGWEAARAALSAARAGLMVHLAPPEHGEVEMAVEVLRHIEEGERLAGLATAEALTAALAAYDRAAAAAVALADRLDLRFAVRRRQAETRARLSALEEAQQAEAAEAIFGRLRNGLTPDGWTASRDLLYAHQTELTAVLDDARRGDVQALAAIFRRVDAGDRIAAQDPATAADLRMAQTFYEEAAEQAERLAPRLDVRFIPRLRRGTLAGRIQKLEAEARVREAEDTWRRIAGLLNPGQWERARDLLYARQADIAPHLSDALTLEAAQLAGFFRDVDEALRLHGDAGAGRPELALALDYCRRAEEKAAALTSGLTVGFIVEMTERRIRARIAALATATTPAPPAPPVPAAAPAPPPAPAGPPRRPVGPETPKADILAQAVDDFERGDFVRATEGFRYLYGRQIEAVQAGGTRRIQGLLALPARYRAEVVFAVEVEKRIGPDGRPDAEAMADLYDQIQGRTGFWAIISEAKRNRLVRFLEGI